MNRRNYIALTLNMVILAAVILTIVPAVKSIQKMVSEIAAAQAEQNQRIADILDRKAP